MSLELTRTSVMKGAAERPFTCLLAIARSSMEEGLFRSSAIFNGIVCLLGVLLLGSLYALDIKVTIRTTGKYLPPIRSFPLFLLLMVSSLGKTFPNCGKVRIA